MHIFGPLFLRGFVDAEAANLSEPSCRHAVHQVSVTARSRKTQVMLPQSGRKTHSHQVKKMREIADDINDFDHV